MRNQARLVVSIAVGLFALGVDDLAHASIQSPPEEACVGKQVDQGCSLPSGEPGVCKAHKCNELDYSQGSPPRSVEVDCVVCIAGAEPPGPGPVPVGEDPAPDRAALDSAPAAADASPVSASESTIEPPSSEARCNVGGDSGGQGWWILLAVGLGVRRRRG